MCTQIISVVFCFNPDNFNDFDLLLGYGMYKCAQLRKAHVAIDADMICTYIQAHTHSSQPALISVYIYIYIYIYINTVIKYLISVAKELCWLFVVM